MNDIEDEARKIAVAWCEEFIEGGAFNLQEKHKLASDIMNYAKHQNEQLREYAQHLLECEMNDGTLEMYWRIHKGYTPQCTCGLDQLLK